MTKQFFITGLPRSRTAWFANLFTWGDSICYHDALHSDPTVGRLVYMLKDVPAVCGAKRGHSCASNLLAWRELDAHFPDAQWVVIERRFDDVLAACSDILPTTRRDALLVMQSQIAGIVEHLDPMMVQFESINMTRCYEIAEYLGIDIGPATRVRQLCDMNIQIHPPVLRKRLESLKCQQFVDTKEAA